MSSFALGQESLRLEGSASADLQDWKLADPSAIKANVKLQGANVEKLLATAGQKLPVGGRLAAAVSRNRNRWRPSRHSAAEYRTTRNPGEQFDRLRAEIRYAGAGVEVINGTAELDPLAFY